MHYISTRDIAAQPVPAAEAIRGGIAPDGGLYVPQSFPYYLPEAWQNTNYHQLARDIMSLYLTDFSATEITDIVARAYSEESFPPMVTPCVTVGGVEVLELFNGPTQAFKDLALQALPHLLCRAMPKCGQDKQAVILVATSGDTGKAALEGFKDVPRCHIIVFYPAGGVSPIQELQMLTTGGKNTGVVSVEGNFDDCQNGVKSLFANFELRQRLAQANLAFSSANSINFGRLLPQIVYYYHAYGQMVNKGVIKAGQSIQAVVPTGNFGNILAAYYAQRMGLPIKRLLCASNENDVLTEAIHSGVYNRVRPFLRTTSPSMDILVSSNFERFLFEMYGRDATACSADFRALNEKGSFTIAPQARERYSSFLSAGSANRALAFGIIERVWQTSGYVLDPHTAIGFSVWERHSGDLPTLLAATASPFKFPEAVLYALGRPVPQDEHEQLRAVAEISGKPIPTTLAALADLPIRHRRHTTIGHMGRVVEQILSI